jgi:hypothetical protein
MSNPLLHRPSPAVGAPHWLSDRLLARVITGLLAFLLAAHGFVTSWVSRCFGSSASRES